MVKVAWIYTLRIEELITYLKVLNKDSTGTVDELRRRFVHCINEANEEEQQRLNAMEEEHKSSPADRSLERESEREEGSGSQATEPTARPTQDTAGQECENENVTVETKGLPKPKQNLFRDEPKEREPDVKKTYAAIDKIRKWGIKYDGGKGSIPFIERVEELAEAYNIDIDSLPRAMPELLKDSALSWYRSNNKRWQFWDHFKGDFLRFFLPARYFENLEDTIRQRTQQVRENFRDYVLSLQDLMRHLDYSDEQKLHRIYRNCRQEYQLHIKRKEFDTLDELLLLAGDYEAIKQPTSHHDTHAHTRTHMERSRLFHTEGNSNAQDDTRIDVANACRRCGNLGHFSRGCNNRSRLFCWTCGRINVKTIDCCGLPSGNEGRAHEERGGMSRQNPQPHNQ